MAFTTTGKANINVTPLIDVLLVLLIIFMVITPTHPVGLNAQLPQPAPDSPQNSNAPDPSVVIRIGRDLAVTINSEATSFEALGDRLRLIFKTRSQKAVFVKAHADTEFLHVARAIDIARDAGIDNVGLLGTK